MEEAEGANVVGELEDEETGEVSSVDYAAFAAAAAAEEPDPSTFGLFIPGLTPIVSNALTAVNAADWVSEPGA